MRIKIDIDIPPWTKWLVSGVATGLALCLGAARLVADTVTAKTDWVHGDTLSAADLNANFKKLQDAINANAPQFQPVTSSFSMQQDPPSGQWTTHPSGAQAVTFSVAGLYKVSLLSRVEHSNNFSDVTTGWTLGGNATRLDSMGICPQGATGSPQNDDQASTCTTLFRATAGQSLTLLPQYRVIYGSGAVHHAFHFDYLVERIGN
jgi:hypothetical protein